ncbi:50S ribosomal protein L25/general stress protein Ctc (plasmid) [Radiobacillus kanasensis]|uniref:50S ribosomal protein L25/general stress protein Ctc n=1 Tax=Radiobacillus kanasensis TaxID=2844358 RepID=UPI001E60C630|nr:50S ribosomal protein L25/general stress protein Ctc [Radiobacillus kanasensis]UFU01522.1 50S ribosomal protein L25/general stress protein Ctc [Radiobacillus kanasensis]
MAVTLKVDHREDLKQSNTRKIRNSGLIPAVVYGKDKDPVTVSVNSLELLKTVRDEGRNAIISLNVNGSTVDVMLHDYQVEPIKGELLHADFYVVNMSQEMDVEVAIHLTGESIGVKDGGVLQQPLYNLAVRAKPANIPEEISVDVTDLAVGDSITVGDLKSGRGYEIQEDDNTTVVTILPPDSGAEQDEVEAPEEIADADSEASNEEEEENKE